MGSIEMIGVRLCNLLEVPGFFRCRSPGAERPVCVCGSVGFLPVSLEVVPPPRPCSEMTPGVVLLGCVFAGVAWPVLASCGVGFLPVSLALDPPPWLCSEMTSGVVLLGCVFAGVAWPVLASCGVGFLPVSLELEPPPWPCSEKNDGLGGGLSGARAGLTVTLPPPPVPLSNI